MAMYATGGPWLVRGATVGAAALAIVLGAGPAFADCHGNGVDSGSADASVGAQGSKQTVAWNLGNREVRVRSKTGDGLNAGKCLDAAFDWMTDGITDGHYDARIARNCRPGTVVQSDADGNGYWLEPSDWGNRKVTGIQKAAGCNYDESNESYGNSCEYVAAGVDNCTFTKAIPFASGDSGPARIILRGNSGALFYNSGGDVQSADS